MRKPQQRLLWTLRFDVYTLRSTGVGRVWSKPAGQLTLACNPGRYHKIGRLMSTRIQMAEGAEVDAN